MYPWLAFRLCAALNPIIYPIFHPSFRKGYKNVYEHIFYSKGKRTARKNLKIVRVKNAKARIQYENKMRHLELEMAVQEQNDEIDENIEIVPIEDLTQNIVDIVENTGQVPIDYLELLAMQQQNGEIVPFIDDTDTSQDGN